MTSAEDQIQRLVDAETDAWNSRDAEALVSLFHPDMVWPWPPDADAHNPACWVMPFGRYDRDRWWLIFHTGLLDYGCVRNPDTYPLPTPGSVTPADSAIAEAPADKDTRGAEEP
jgi:hypothetical protein